VTISVTGSKNAFSIVCHIAEQRRAKERRGEEGRGEEMEMETSEPRDHFDPSAGGLGRPASLRGVAPRWDNGRSEKGV
jgi:hypothetical protein